MFWNLILGIASFALNLLLTPKPQNAKGASFSDLDVPVAEEGRPISYLFGTKLMRVPNVTWYGDFKRTDIKGARRYGFFGPRQVIGHRYHLGMQLTSCQSCPDILYEIRVGDKIAWKGTSQGGPIIIKKSDLFGGDSGEGGISGRVDVCMGEATQAKNDYLVNQLGADTPAFRGEANLILNQVYLGTSPYIKPWAMKWQRIYKDFLGNEQWYPEKAGIGETSTATPEVNEVVSSPSGISTNDYGIDLKHGYLVNGGTNLLQCWKYPDFTTPLWTRTDVGADLQGVTIDDLGNILTCDQNGSTMRCFDIETGEDKGSTPSMGFIGNGAIACITLLDDLTGIESTWAFILQGNILYMANGSSSFTAVDNVSGLFPWLTGALGFAVSPSRVYVPNNGFLILDGTQKVRMTTWGTLGFGGVTEVDLSADMFGDIISVSYLEDIDGVLIIDDDSGIHIYSADLSTRILYKHGTDPDVDDENNWGISTPSHLMCNRIDRGSGTVAFRAIGNDGYGGNVFVQYNIADLSLVSIVDASDLPYVHDNDTTYTYSGVDPDKDYMVVGAQSSSLSAWSLPPSGGLDMNPAHIIRECIVNIMRYDDADVDDTIFTSAADTLYDEGFGLTFDWANEVEIREFVTTVLSHIDAVTYVSRTTGKYVLKLIRADYDIDTIKVVTEDDIDTWEESSARGDSDAANMVTVKYTNPDEDKDAAKAVHNIAQIQMLGEEINVTRFYPGITKGDLATRVATRDLKSLAPGMRSGTIVCKRTVEDLNPGDPFRLVSSARKYSGEVMRVMDINYGDGRTNKITIKFLQDVFNLEDDLLVEEVPTSWTPTSPDPVASTVRLVEEMSYYELAKYIGTSEASSLLVTDPLAGMLQSSAGKPVTGSLDLILSVDAGTGFATQVEPYSFAPVATLDGDLAQFATSVDIANIVDRSGIATGRLAWIDGEYVRVDNLIDNTLTLSRGCLDTLPAPHSTGASIIFFDNDLSSDAIAYTDAVTVYVKQLVETGNGRLPLAAAPSDTVTFDNRAIRPLRPANVEVEGQNEGPIDGTGLTDFDVTWVNRNRLTEVTPLSWTDADVTPESGQTTIIEVLDPSGTIVTTTHSGLTGTSFSVPLASFGGDSSGFIRVGSERDGYREWEAFTIEVLVDAELLTLDGDELFLGTSHLVLGDA